MVHILLKPGLENFEHCLTSVWDECNCAVVWIFFGIAFLWDWNENMCSHNKGFTNDSFLVIWDFWRAHKIFQSDRKKRIGLWLSLRPKSMTPYHLDIMGWIFLFPIPLPCSQTLVWQDKGGKGDGLGREEGRSYLSFFPNCRLLTATGQSWGLGRTCNFESLDRRFLLLNWMCVKWIEVTKMSPHFLRMAWKVQALDWILPRVRGVKLVPHSEFKGTQGSTRAFLVVELVKNLPAMWETWVGSLGCERVTGRKARGLQTEGIGSKCQTFLSLKQQEETN